jgi:hypothetical protein
MSELYAYIDESGILQKHNNPNHQYFVISIILTEQPKNLARNFKRSLLKSIKDNDELMKILTSNKEIKGSEFPEIRKSKIYSDLISTSIVSEYGIIVVDTLKIEDKFKENAARAFNYLLKVFLQNYMKSKNKHPNCTKLKLYIDERNIATKSMYTLKEYLNTELVMAESVFLEDFEVIYCDSKIQPLIQLSDFIANTTLRGLSGNNEAAKTNIAILKPRMTNNNFFMFSKGK